MMQNIWWSDETKFLKLVQSILSVCAGMGLKIRPTITPSTKVQLQSWPVQKQEAFARGQQQQCRDPNQAE